jgi:hypothetical protein
MLERYYNLYDPAKQYSELLFRAGDGLQSRELNEMQTTLKQHIKSVGDALLKDGDIVTGCGITVDPDTADVRLGEGRMYLAGKVRDIPSKNYAVPSSGTVFIGVRLSDAVITELEDPTLREPAVGTRNYQEPGAGRLQETVAWGWLGPDGTSDDGEGQFYPVYIVVNAILQNKTRPPSFDGVSQMIARYDYDANGHYIVDGLTTKFIHKDQEVDEHVFLLSSGIANVRGFKVEREYDQRLRLPIDPDLETITAEPHVFSPDGNGRMEMELNRVPLAQVLRITGTVEKSASVTHSAYSGGADTLPDMTVVEVLEVSQGETTFAEGTDYTVSGGAINWSAAGAEPAPGSSYSVTYNYIKSVSPEATTDTSVTVSGLVSSTIVQIDYTWKMPRVDAVVLDKDGATQVLKGVSTAWNPQPASEPGDRLKLANIEYDWFSDHTPVVRNVGVRTVKTDDLAGMQQDIVTLYDMLARESLKNDLTIREPAAKKGIFVDPFIDSDMRDAGANQNAAIFNGVMRAPQSASVVGTYLSNPCCLPFDLNPVLDQPARTGSMKVNQYSAILPMPASVTLKPSADQWQEVETQWADAITETISNRATRDGGYGVYLYTRTSSNTRTELISVEEEMVEFLRQITVEFAVSGFGPSEAVSAMRFDGLDLSVSEGLMANDSGHVAGSFIIPEQIPAGQKLFEIEGAGGSYGSASFYGQGGLKRVETWRQRVTTTNTRWYYDPLAQTFALDDSCMLGGVDLWFTAKGTKDVLVQIRETRTGFPINSVLTEERLDASAIKTDGTATRVVFNSPVWLEAGTEYAVGIITDDTEHALAVAEVGKWDSHNKRWITAQPYQIGTLLSSSNASTWSTHQNKDLAFRLLGCKFTSTQRTIQLASDISVNQMTDIMAMGVVERPASGCDVGFVVTLDDGRRYAFGEFSGASFPDKYTGNITLSAELKGTSSASPVLAPDVQFVAGSMADDASYVSRAVTADETFNVRIVGEVLSPGTSSVTVFIEHDTEENFVAVDFEQGEPVGDGWVEMTWKGQGFSGISLDNITRVKMTLANTAQYRAQVRNLRMIVT